MSPKAKKEYTALMAKRYRRSNNKQKTIILNEFCQVTGCHRKHAIRKLKHFKFFSKRQKKPGRPKVYNQDVLSVLRKIWLTANLPCGKRLKPILGLWLPSYIQTYGTLNPEVITLLKTISSATIDRLFKAVRPKFKKRGFSATRPGTLLRKQIPIKTD